MSTICKNCRSKFEGNFCSHCGQAANTHKLTMHFILHDLQHGLLHVDHGIFYTIKQILTRPGHTIREFINGERVKHFKPFTLLIILATVYGLLYHYFIHNLFNVNPIGTKETIVGAYEKLVRWMTDHFAYATLILVLNTTIASYLVFRRQGYNFAEHLVLNTFYRSAVLVIILALFPLLYVYQERGSQGLTIYLVTSQLLDFLFMYWCYAQFFNKISKLKSLGLTILTYFFMSAINLVLGYLIGWIVSLV
jgi:hypothetical protein